MSINAKKLGLTKKQAKKRDKWVKALRSGRFKQGEGCLRNDLNGEWEYCYLGVLAHISKKKYFDTNAVPSIEIMRSAGINHADAGRLIELNDDHRVPFCDIATLLENLPVEDA